MIRGGVDLHVADAPWLISELAALGVEASFVPTVSEKMASCVSPLPERFRVLAYVPDQRREFYGWNVIREVAAALPPIEVVAVAGSCAADAPANVRWTGYLDEAGMDAVYRETSALIRPTRHDGLSQMVLEAMGRGRHVVWTKAFPYCRQAQTTEDFISAVSALAASCSLNEAGAAYVRQNFTPAAAAQALAAAYDRIPLP